MRELHTERLLLRTPRERDAAEIMAIHNSAFVMKNNVMEVFDKEQMVHLIIGKSIMKTHGIWSEKRTALCLV